MMKKHIRAFQQEGFSLRVDAMNSLRAVLDQQGEEETRVALVQAVLEDLKAQTSAEQSTHCVVTLEQLNQALQSLYNKQTMTKEEKAIVLTDAFDFSLLHYNSSRNTFDR